MLVTVTVNVMPPPGRRRGAVGDLGDGEVGAAFDRGRRPTTIDDACRRAAASTSVAAAVFVDLVPVIPGATVPVIVIRVGGTWRTREIDDSTVPSSHVTTWPDTVHDPCDDVAAAGTRPAGSVSVTTTFSASELSRSTSVHDVDDGRPTPRPGT